MIVHGRERGSGFPFSMTLVQPIARRKTSMFGRSIPLLRLAGFQVGIDWSWLILAILIAWTLSVGVFPSYYPDLTPGLYWSMGVIAALGLFASIILHELAHSLVARRHGLLIRGITLFVFGGVAEMEAEPDRPAVEFRVAIAGPIASFLSPSVFGCSRRLPSWQGWACQSWAFSTTSPGSTWFLRSSIWCRLSLWTAGAYCGPRSGAGRAICAGPRVSPPGSGVVSASRSLRSAPFAW